MSELVPARGFVASRQERHVRRVLSRLDGRGRLELARIQQEGDLQADRVAAIAYVGKRAMHEVTMLTQLEIQLGAIVPSATPRLQGIGDIAALAMADVVAETIRKVR